MLKRGRAAYLTLLDVELVRNARCGHPPEYYRSSARFQTLAQICGLSTKQLWRSYCDEKQFLDTHRSLLRFPTEGTSSLSDTHIDEVVVSKDIDACDAQGRSALAWAVEYQWPEAVSDLLGHGASVHKPRSSIGSPARMPLLHLAVAAPPSSSMSLIVDMLLKHEPDIFALDNEAWTVGHIAASWGNDNVLAQLAYALAVMGSSLRSKFEMMVTADGHTIASLRSSVAFSDCELQYGVPPI